MRTLEEARDTLQISQEDIDFLVSGIRRAGEPIAIIAYGSRARGEAKDNSDYDILALSNLTGRELKDYSLTETPNCGDSTAILIFSPSTSMTSKPASRRKTNSNAT